MTSTNLLILIFSFMIPFFQSVMGLTVLMECPSVPRECVHMGARRVGTPVNATKDVILYVDRLDAANMMAYVQFVRSDSLVTCVPPSAVNTATLLDTAPKATAHVVRAKPATPVLHAGSDAASTV